MKTLPALCLLLSLCASGQQAANQEKPLSREVLRTVPVTELAYSCRKGWKLQVWTIWANTKGQHGEGYKDTSGPEGLSSFSDAHPPRCAKDILSDTRKSHAVATVPRPKPKIYHCGTEKCLADDGTELPWPYHVGAPMELKKGAK